MTLYHISAINMDDDIDPSLPCPTDDERPQTCRKTNQDLSTKASNAEDNLTCLRAQPTQSALMPSSDMTVKFKGPEGCKPPARSPRPSPRPRGTSGKPQKSDRAKDLLLW